jgi:26S proteasome regulatory subunit T5
LAIHDAIWASLAIVTPRPSRLPLPPCAGAGAYQDAGKKGKCIVLKTSTRQTVFLPVAGLVDPEALKPGDLVGVNKDSYLILDTLPPEYDSRVKAMEVDEKPTEDYSDIGGLDKQVGVG